MSVDSAVLVRRAVLIMCVGHVMPEGRAVYIVTVISRTHCFCHYGQKGLGHMHRDG